MARKGKPADTHDVIDALNDMIAGAGLSRSSNGYTREERKRRNDAERIWARAMKFGIDIGGARGS